MHNLPEALLLTNTIANVTGGLGKWPFGGAVPDRVDVVTMQRWFLPLPQALPLPDGWTHTEQVAARPDERARPDDVAVTVVIHQVPTMASRTMSVYRAVMEIIANSVGEAIGSEPVASSTAQPLMTSTTVVEALTTAESPTPPSASTAPGSWSPREDGLMRCLRLVSDLARAYCVATQVPIQVPSYERLPSLVLVCTAPGERATSGTRIATRSTGQWSAPTSVLLHHGNLPDPAIQPPVSTELGSPFYEAMRALRTGDPRFVYRERVTEALRALRVDGSYPQAVVLAVTAAEVLIDWLLALLLWETERSTADLAAIYCERSWMHRLTVALPDRLGGNWSTTSRGPVATWHESAYRLRHRVVHGGLVPTRAQASQAVDATIALERHAMDRIVDRRTKFPRVALMTVAQRGLERRDLWSGKIRQFAETVAAEEPSWGGSFNEWYAHLTNLRVENLA